MSEAVRYLVFDVESVADAPLVARLRYPGQRISPATALRRYRDELMAKHDSDFVPYTFQIPIAVAAGKISADYRLMEVVVLDEPEFRPHAIAEKFWRGWEKYGHPTLVSFGGRGFDLPLLELTAFRYGISVPAWFGAQRKSAGQFRNRFNTESHVDLLELLTNFGASRFTGGLNLAANLIGKPGKMQVQGNMVQDLYTAGKLREINDYCRCDVLDTYFVFLRTRVLVGELTVAAEQKLINETKTWLKKQATKVSAYKSYLEHWGDWVNPWK